MASFHTIDFALAAPNYQLSLPSSPVPLTLRGFVYYHSTSCSKPPTIVSSHTSQPLSSYCDGPCPPPYLLNPAKPTFTSHQISEVRTSPRVRLRRCDLPHCSAQLCDGKPLTSEHWWSATPT